MKIMVDVLKKYIALALVSVLGLITIIYFNSIVMHMLAIWLVVFVAIAIVSFNFTHPYFWFSLSYAIYGTAYPLLLILGHTSVTGYTKENSILVIVGLSITLLIIGPNEINLHINNKDYKNYLLSNFYIHNKLLKFILRIGNILLLIMIVLLMEEGIQHKAYYWTNTSVLFTLSYYLTRYLSLFLIMYIIISCKHIKKAIPLISLTIISVFIFSMFTGERDAIFRITLVFIVSMYFVGILERKHLPLLMFLGVLFLITVTNYKYYFMYGVVNRSFEGRGILYNFLMSDFSAAGENLQVLINNEWTKGSQSILLLIDEFISAIFIGYEHYDIATNFNELFYKGSYSRAFTILGEGYIIG